MYIVVWKHDYKSKHKSILSEPNVISLARETTAQKYKCNADIHHVPKTSTFYFWNDCQKLTDFNDIWQVKFWEKFEMKILQTSPPHLSDVAILPWEIQKSHF